MGLIDVVNSIVDVGQNVSDFMTNGIYDFCVSAYAEFVKYMTIGMITTKMFFIKFSWDVAKELINSFNISPIINSLWSHLDNSILQVLTTLKIPESINILFSSFVTRYIMRFSGF